MKIIEASGARIPAIGFGTYTLEGEQCADMVEKAIAAGYRHIDTARMYRNEREVGEGIRRSGIATDDLFVTTKIWWTDIGRRELVASAERAIEAIGNGPVDLLLIHWPNPDIALEESIEALNETVTRGLTRHIGVANFTSAMLDEAAAISAIPLVCNQVEYHPFLSQDAILDACRRHDMALVAYSPVGQGGDILRHATIVELADKYGRTPAQIVLRWEVDQDRVGAIPRTKRPERLAENLAVFDFALTEEETEAVNGLCRPGKRLVDPAFAPNWDRV